MGRPGQATDRAVPRWWVRLQGSTVGAEAYVGTTCRNRPPIPPCWSGSRPADDAAVYKINDEQGVVATTDFFMPHRRRPIRLWPDRGHQCLVRRPTPWAASRSWPWPIAGFPVNDMTTEQIQGRSPGRQPKPCLDAGVTRRRRSHHRCAGNRSTASRSSVWCTRTRSSATRDALAGDVLVLGKGASASAFSARP